MVHTHSSPPDSNSGPVELIAEIKAKADWSESDETKLIEFFANMQAQTPEWQLSGQVPATFRGSVWKATADHMEQFCTKGGPKNAAACKRKWGKLCYFY